MNNELMSTKDMAVAAISRLDGSNETMEPHGVYTVQCHDADGNLKWEDTIDNLVTTAGKNFNLDTVFAGSTYTAVWYLGLISATSYTTGPAVGDTMASHGGWAEDQNYSSPAARGTCSWSTAASGGSKSLASSITFTMNASTTIKGCFMVTNSTKGGTTGTLYSAGTFTGGDKIVQSSDQLSVSYTATLT